MFTVLINGLRKAEETATALECRGFGAYPDRSYVKLVFKQFSFHVILLLWKRNLI
jgi:energy-coupling factor transporter transmembrane protein EcfT